MKTLITTSLSVILVSVGLLTLSSCKADRVDPEYDLEWNKIPTKNIALVDIDGVYKEIPIEDFFIKVEELIVSKTNCITFITGNEDRDLSLYWDSPEGLDNITPGTFGAAPYSYLNDNNGYASVTGAIKIIEFAPLSEWRENENRDTLREIMIKGTFHLKNKLPDGTIHNYKCAFYYEGVQWEGARI